MKRTLHLLACSVLLCLCVIFAVPHANAADMVASGYCGGEGDGTNLTWVLDSKGALTISGNGKMADYTFYTKAPWNTYCRSITKVLVKDGITTIGDCAFYSYENLSDITLANSIIGLGEYAFSWCSSVTDVTIPTGVTVIGEWAFSWCQSLTTITIPYGVTTIGEYAFYDCRALTTVNLPSSITDIGKDAFFYCLSLTEITVPDDITTIRSGVFNGCKALSSIALPSGLTSIESSAFSECLSLQTITLPETLTTIGSFAFSECEALSSISIPAATTDIGIGVLASCTSLQRIEVDPNNPIYSTDPAGVLFNKDKTCLLQYPAGRTSAKYDIPSGVTTIKEAAFRNSFHLETVTFPSTLAGELCAFSGCSSLRSIEIPYGVTTIGSFAYCIALESIIIPNSVTTIRDYGFELCTALTSVSIPDSVTDIGMQAFDHCTSLKKVSFGSGLKNIGIDAFNGCGELTLIFTGDAPVCSSDICSSSSAHFAYYPADNASWTEEKLQNYGGEITWVPYTADMTYHTHFSMDAIPQSMFELAVTVTRLGDTAAGTAVIGLYADDGKFLETITHTLTDDIAQTFTLVRDNTNGKIDSVKVFLPDSLAALSPLASAAGI